MYVFIWHSTETKNADSQFFEDETEAEGFIYSTPPSKWPDVVLKRDTTCTSQWIDTPIHMEPALVFKDS